MSGVTEVQRDTRKPYARWLGVALSIVLLAWILHIADLRNLWRSLTAISPAMLVLTILLGYLSIPLRALQWQLLLGRPPEATNWRTLKAICIGHVGNFLLPMRGGEFIRAYILAKDTGLPFTRVLLSVFLSRLQDIPPIALLCAAVLGFVSISPDAVQHTAEILGMYVPEIPSDVPQILRLFAIPLAICGIAFLFGHRVWRFATHLVRPRSGFLPNTFNQRLSNISDEIESGLTIVGARGNLWAAQAIAGTCWVIFALAPIPLLMAFSLDFKQAALTAIVKTAIGTLGQMLPSAPGSIGTFHAFCLVAVLAVNPTMDRDTAMAYVFVAHLVSTLSPALPGLFFLPNAWVDLSTIRSTAISQSTVSSK